VRLAEGHVQLPVLVERPVGLQGIRAVPDLCRQRCAARWWSADPRDVLGDQARGPQFVAGTDVHGVAVDGGHEQRRTLP
jgi:hypothetical protein